MSVPVLREKNTPFQITVPNYREPLSGIVTTAMALGALVQLKNTGDARELIAANGGLPCILENQVMTDANWQAYCKANPMYQKSDIRMPVPVGSAVSARFAYEAEFEGTGYFTGIDGTTAVLTPLKTAAGKFAIGVHGTDRIIGYLQRLVTPHESTSFRWVVTFV